jgi:uncharacterized protein (TIGR02147 family)
MISFLQEKEGDFSLRQLSKKCEFAVSYLPMVLSSKRNLSEASAEILKKPLKLKADEFSYLKYMLTMNDTSSREEKLETLKRMQKFNKYTSENSKELEAYKYLTKWQYVALREMVMLDQFKNAPEWIQNNLTFTATPKEITDGLEFLLKNNFIGKGAKGKLQVKDKMVDCFEGIYRLSLGEFYKQIFQLAIESIEAVPRNERLLLGHTFAVSNEAFDQINKVLTDALEKIREIEKKDVKKERVYQVNLTAFPLTKKGNS